MSYNLEPAHIATSVHVQLPEDYTDLEVESHIWLDKEYTAEELLLETGHTAPGSGLSRETD